MGKVILEFDSITEQEEYQTAIDGSKWKIAMWDLDQKLRATTKYGESVLNHTKATSLEIEIAEQYRGLIIGILEKHNLLL
jgi:hypothetical protein